MTYRTKNSQYPQICTVRDKKFHITAIMVFYKINVCYLENFEISMKTMNISKVVYDTVHGEI